jgi:DNA-binding FrmR family transcriptional regulator
MHLEKDRQALLKRANRLIGQLNAVRDLIASGEGDDCYTVLQQLAAARGALDSMARLFLEGHILEHVVQPGKPAERRAAGEELVRTLKSFLR